LLDRDNELPRRPLVIFAFDEAHILTDNPSTMNRATTWNLFLELRRILRETSGRAIFSLFLSTAGRFNSFDDPAYDAPEYEIMLEQVVEIDWMCHLGRPLALLGYHFSEHLTSHLEQVRVRLRR